MLHGASRRCVACGGGANLTGTVAGGCMARPLFDAKRPHDWSPVQRTKDEGQQVWRACFGKWHANAMQTPCKRAVRHGVVARAPGRGKSAYVAHGMHGVNTRWCLMHIACMCIVGACSATPWRYASQRRWRCAHVRNATQNMPPCGPDLCAPSWHT